MIFSLQATGLTTRFTLEQEMQLLAIGIGLVVLLLLNHFLIWRCFRRMFRWIGHLPLLEVFGENDVSLARWMETLFDLALITTAVLLSLNVAGVDISAVTSWARDFGFDILEWFGEFGHRIILIIALAYLANRTVLAMLVPVIRSSVTRGKTGTPLEEANKRAVALTQVARHTARITIMIMAGLMLLGVFEINIGPIIAGLGVVGIAVGFGAQHTVRDIIAGSFIIGEDQYRVGDVVSVAGRTKFDQRTFTASSGRRAAQNMSA